MPRNIITPTPYSIDNQAREIVKRRRVRCDCGGPYYGTDHAPDCALVLAYDDAREEAEDFQWEMMSEGRTQ